MKLEKEAKREELLAGRLSRKVQAMARVEIVAHGGVDEDMAVKEAHGGSWLSNGVWAIT